MQPENKILGKQLAQKLNKSAAPTSIVLPLKGISQIDAEGGVFYRPEINQVLFDSIKNNVAQAVDVKEVDAHINDYAFSEILVKTLLEMIQRTKI